MFSVIILVIWPSKIIVLIKFAVKLQIIMPAQGLVNKVMELLMRKRFLQIENFIKNPIDTQESVLFSNLSAARNTDYGKLYGFDEIDSYTEFCTHVPLVKYEDFEPYIERARKGEPDV